MLTTNSRRFSFFFALFILSLVAVISCTEDTTTGPNKHVIIEQSFELSDTGVFYDMIWIEPGSFMMGAQPSEEGAEDQEYPRHLVTLTEGFWLGKYEMSQAQWEAIFGEWEFQEFDDPTFPAHTLSWNQLDTLLFPLLDEGWRLPTEAEWEYTCRAGNDDDIYWWGDDWQTGADYAWFFHVDNTTRSVMPIGQKDPNPWGLYDMLGNVSEMTNDYWTYFYYSDSPARDPLGAEDSQYKVIRGGSWHDEYDGIRIAKRSYGRLASNLWTVGFRLAYSE